MSVSDILQVEELASVLADELRLMVMLMVYLSNYTRALAGAEDALGAKSYRSVVLVCRLWRQSFALALAQQRWDSLMRSVRTPYGFQRSSITYVPRGWFLTRFALKEFRVPLEGLLLRSAGLSLRNLHRHLLAALVQTWSSATSAIAAAPSSATSARPQAYGRAARRHVAPAAAAPGQAPRSVRLIPSSGPACHAVPLRRRASPRLTSSAARPSSAPSAMGWPSRPASVHGAAAARSWCWRRTSAAARRSWRATWSVCPPSIWAST